MRSGAVTSAPTDASSSLERTTGPWRWRRWPRRTRVWRSSTIRSVGRLAQRVGSPESMPPDYSKIIEFPRRKAGRAQVQVIARRYHLAKELAGGKRVLEAGCGAGFGLGCLVTS